MKWPLAKRWPAKSDTRLTTGTVDRVVELHPATLPVDMKSGSSSILRTKNGSEIISTPANGDRKNSFSSEQPGVLEGLLNATSSIPSQPMGTFQSQSAIHHEGIYWRSPITMVAFLFLGIFASIAHHIYYTSLDGNRVGNDREQQWALRSGLSFVDFPQRCVTYLSHLANMAH
jgi:hypothetical protein